MKVFISYRRRDWPFTQRLRESLSKLIDAEIFLDEERIDDDDFERSILGNLRQADAVLVIVTERTFDPQRITNEGDWVRREVALALALDKIVIPVTVDGILLPKPEDVPADLAAISAKQTIPFYSTYFDAAVDKLATFMSRATPIRRRTAAATTAVKTSPWLPLLVILAVVFIGIILVVLFQLLDTVNKVASAGTEAAIQASLQPTIEFIRQSTRAAQTATAASLSTATPDLKASVAAAQTLIAAATLTESALRPTSTRISQAASPTPTPPGQVSIPTETARAVFSTTTAQAQIELAATATAYNIVARSTVNAASTSIAAASSTPTLTPSPTQASLNSLPRFDSPLTTEYMISAPFGVNGHRGTDLSARVGDPVHLRGNASVYDVVRCTRCTEAQPNFASQNIPSFDARALQDPAWGFGYGNYIVLQYAYNDLPTEMRTWLDDHDLTDSYVYVIYAQLSEINIEAGQVVSAGEQVGAVGNTGSSTGPHLHIEVRATMSGSSMAGHVAVDPALLFSF
jgi:murein DD-endopeptidase MepM/ murein hydrolase activator NlpD